MWTAFNNLFRGALSNLQAWCSHHDARVVKDNTSPVDLTWSNNQTLLFTTPPCGYNIEPVYDLSWIYVTTLRFYKKNFTDTVAGVITLCIINQNKPQLLLTFTVSFTSHVDDVSQASYERAIERYVRFRRFVSEMIHQGCNQRISIFDIGRPFHHNCSCK